MTGRSPDAGGTTASGIAADASSRTCLLIGGNGFVGRNLAATLERAGHRALIAGRRRGSGDPPATLPLPLGDTDAIVEAVRREGVDCVVHLACGLLPSSDQGAYLWEVAEVALPTMRLAGALATIGVAFAFVSSGGTVYGANAGAPLREDDPCRPISLYGQAKLEIELHLDFLARTRGLDLLILRPSNPYGPHQSLRGAQGLISVVLGRIADGLPLEIWGDGSVVRDYIHVDDASAAIMGLIERRAYGVFNVGSGVGHSLIEVVEMAERATGRQVERRFRPGRSVDVPRLVLDVGRLAALGLDRARPLADGIAHYAARLGMAAAG